jgi:outer membrane lipopolysaccharide assembly protein LptE/RlpB
LPPESGKPGRKATEISEIDFYPFSSDRFTPCLCASVALFFFGMLLAGCGYHVAGRAGRLPANVKTIAVPALENRTIRYRIEQRLTEAVVRELLARTSYRVVADPAAADAVLRGEITGLESSAVVFDAATGRATTLLVTLRAQVRLEERETKKLLYRNDNFLFREPYEISTDVASFFAEQDPALGRLARDFASRLVADLLENF